MSLRVAVFASGGGSNLQASIDHFHARADAPVRIVVVVSDRADAGALERSRAAGIDTIVIRASGRPVDYVAREMLATLESADVDLVVLAGYLRLIPPAVVRRFRQRIVNIHPALLPAFGGKGMFGLHVQRRVLESGATVTGATVHLVDEQYDEGTIVAQWPVPVLPHDTPETLADRVLRVEHMLFPAVVEAMANALEKMDTDLRLGPTGTAAAFDCTPNERPDAGAMRRALGLES